MRLWTQAVLFTLMYYAFISVDMLSVSCLYNIYFTGKSS